MTKISFVRGGGLYVGELDAFGTSANKIKENELVVEVRLGIPQSKAGAKKFSEAFPMLEKFLGAATDFIVSSSLFTYLFIKESCFFVCCTRNYSWIRKTRPK